MFGTLVDTFRNNKRQWLWVPRVRRDDARARMPPSQEARAALSCI